jgi:hypothetical protein
VTISTNKHHSKMTMRCCTAVVATCEEPMVASPVIQIVSSVVSPEKSEDELTGSRRNSP